MANVVALHLLLLLCPSVQPPVAPGPISGVVMGQVNHERKGTWTARLLRDVTDETMKAIVRAVPKLGDLLRPNPWNNDPVRWDRKISILLDLQQGNDKEYKLILKKIIEKRDEAKARSELFAKGAAKIEYHLNRFPVANPDYLRSRQQQIQSARRTEGIWHVIYIAHSKEGEVLEAMGQAVIKARLTKRAPSP